MATPSGSPSEQKRIDVQGPTFVAADAHALVIGVGPGRREGAARVRDVLADPRYGGYLPEQVQLATDEGATNQGIRTVLRELAERVAPASTVVVCCLCPVTTVAFQGAARDFDALVLSERRGNVLPLPELYGFLGTLPARHVLFAYEGSRPDVGLTNAGPGRVAIGAAVPHDAVDRFPRALVAAVRETRGEHGASVARLFETMRAAMAREATQKSQYPLPLRTPALAGDFARDFVVTGGTDVATRPAATPPGMPNAYALLVGVDAYPTARLTEATPGAVAMRDALVAGGYAPANVRLLLDHEATRDAVLAALDELLGRTDADATVLGYFAGHGTTVSAAHARERGALEPALVPVDYKRAGVITAADLAERLARTRARRGVIIADCDHSEGIGGGGAPGRVWMAATRLDQVGYEVPGGPGRFTAALLAGLQGGAADADGAVRVLTLFEYAHQQVAASPDARGVYPTIGGDLSDDFVVARTPGTVPSALAPASDGYRYDAYLSFAAEDAELVRSRILPPLVEAGVRIAVSRDVDRPGAYRVATAERGLAQARRGVVVAASGSARAEANLAFTPASSEAWHEGKRVVHLDAAPNAEREPYDPNTFLLDEVLGNQQRFAEFVTWLHDPEARLTPRAPDVYISVAWRDREPAQRVADALEADGLAVWLDRDALGSSITVGDAIGACALFVPILSRRTGARDSGHFRAEWAQAVQRSSTLPADAAFILPVLIDDTPGAAEAGAGVPDAFRRVQWARLPNGHATPAFVARVAELVRRARDAAPNAAPGEAQDAAADPRAWVSRLTHTAERALRLAESGRHAAGRPAVDTAHLLAGLYNDVGGWTRAVVEVIDAESRWLELSALASLMGFTSPLPNALPRVEPAPREALRTLPLTDGARQVIEEGVRLAGEDAERPVSGRHLLAALLSRPDDPTARWLAAALRVERGALHRVVAHALAGEATREQLVEQVLALRAGPAGRTFAHDSAVHTLAFHPDGATLAVGHYDGSVRVYDTASGEALATLAEPNALVVASLAWSPDGTMLAADFWEGGARVWERPERRPGGAPPQPRVLTSARLAGLRFTPNGRWLLGWTTQGNVHLWAVPSFREFAMAAPDGVEGTELDITFTPDARFLFAIGDAVAHGRPVAGVPSARPPA